jgi:Icc-related predicted phosphoesterase
MDTKRVIKLLCVSDTHLAWKFIDEAAKLAHKHDFVILTGDLGRFNHETKEVSDVEAQSDMDTVLRRLEAGFVCLSFCGL